MIRCPIKPELSATVIEERVIWKTLASRFF